MKRIKTHPGDLLVWRDEKYIDLVLCNEMSLRITNGTTIELLKSPVILPAGWEYAHEYWEKLC